MESEAQLADPAGAGHDAASIRVAHQLRLERQAILIAQSQFFQQAMNVGNS